MKPLPAVFTVLTVLCLTSCTERDRTRADLIVINGAEVGTIDPALCSAQTEGRIITALFEGLAATVRAYLAVLAGTPRV